MVDNQGTILLIGAVLIGLFIFQRRNKEKMFRYWKIGMTVGITSAVWLWYERITMFTATVGYGSLILVAFVVVVAWLVYGIYRTEMPT